MPNPIAIGAASIGSSLLGASSSRQAASQQADAADRAAQLQYDQWQQQRADQAPFREAGLTSQNRLMELMGIGGNAGAEGYGKYGRDFSMQDFQQDPGYGFRLSEGLKGLDRQAAARGGLISGAALKAATRYGQDMGSQEYQNAFNRYQTNRSNQLNPLQSLMGAGQSATNQVGASGQQYANNAGQAYQNAGEARASGYMGQANALAGGAGQYMNYQQNQNLMNQMNQRRNYPNSNWGGGSSQGNSGGYDYLDF